jgi:hypothetical protein
MSVFGAIRGWFERPTAVDERVGELAEKSRLDPQEVAWLEERFQSDRSIRARYEALRRYHQAARGAPPIEAPSDFFAQTLARVRREEDVLTSERVVARPRWIWGAATMAVATALFVVVINQRHAEPEPTQLTTSGRSGTDRRADLVVRAPGLGAAEARSMFEAAVRAAGGQLEVQRDFVVADVPRTGLIDLLEALTQRSEVELSRDEHFDVEGRSTLVIRFEL